MNSKLLQRICYACGTFGHDVFYAMIGTYFMIFVTSNLFHSDNPSHDAYMIGIVTTIILVLRILELFVDPFIGNLIDKTKTRWGRLCRSHHAGFPVHGLRRPDGHESDALPDPLRHRILHHGYLLQRERRCYLVHDPGALLRFA